MALSRQPGVQTRPQIEILDPAQEETKSAYQELLDDVSNAILDSSADGQIIFVNSAACEISGYAREQLLAMTIQQLFIHECLPALQTLLDADPETREGTSAEVQITASSGSRVHLHLKARVRKLNGRIASVRWIGRDVSGLARAQERIQYLEEHGRLVFQISADAVAINRLDDGTYVEVNEGFLESTGFTRQDLIGVSSLDLGIWANPAEREHLAATLARDVPRDYSAARKNAGQERHETGRSLTRRQRQVVQLLAEGGSNKHVGLTLNISIKTAETHRANIMRKIECHSVAGLVRYAIRNRIIEA